MLTEGYDTRHEGFSRVMRPTRAFCDLRSFAFRLPSKELTVTSSPPAAKEHQTTASRYGFSIRLRSFGGREPMTIRQPLGMFHRVQFWFFNNEVQVVSDDRIFSE
jgi:hypothetical protein